MSSTGGRVLYTYSLDKCDVQDKTKLADFRKARAEWVDLLEKDPLHSVSRQLSGLVWQDAVFRLFNEAWRIEDPAQPSGVTAPLLAEALVNGYVANLVLGVGRLTDKADYGKSGARNVVSLKRLVEEIKSKRDLITREIFVCYDGLVYDVNTIPPPSRRGSGGFIGVEIGGPFDWSTPTLLHEHFDGLSGVDPSARSRTDTIADAAFDEIETLLSCPEIEKLRELRNKVIAHAADPISRAHLSSFGFKLQEAKVALHALCWAYHRVQINLLWNSGGGVMPIPQFDIFDRMDISLLSQAQTSGLPPFWQQVVAERERWVKEPPP
ncbi:hypothetical protein JMJ55_24205 [Belnapia sp. T6]|uniref:HEPN AbiU2-like domain-containing protein n=1 Tax=Belnapia mucosa TaxID=2804532 RepID=A0ABS1V9V7_9PROT|nr:hypothetical protein [Belnapia mucosa]MBL6458445.1 hypothetical protein [Belnapia mucosa]